MVNIRTRGFCVKPIPRALNSSPRKSRNLARENLEAIRIEVNSKKIHFLSDWITYLIRVIQPRDGIASFVSNIGDAYVCAPWKVKFSPEFKSFYKFNYSKYGLYF